MLKMDPPPSPADKLRNLRAAFIRDASKAVVRVFDADVTIEPSENLTTGSIGYRGEADIFVTIDGRPVRAKATVTITITGSNKWPRGSNAGRG